MLLLRPSTIYSRKKCKSDVIRNYILNTDCRDIWPALIGRVGRHGNRKGNNCMPRDEVWVMTFRVENSLDKCT